MCGCIDGDTIREGNMSTEPQLFRVNPESRESESIEEVDFASLGLRERRDIQEWVAANPGILGDDLLIIGKEFSGFDRTNERLDLLAVDADGKLVIIELKRDDTGADAHWQAIKYASYFNRASPDDVVGLLATYGKISESDAQRRLLDHIESDSIEVLNNSQRIVLASHRFAPEVTSAALWLNQKLPGEDMITCVQLTPYQDANTNSLYIQANTIIPVPGIDEYIVGIGDSAEVGVVGTKYAQTQKKANRNDEITAFLRGVADRVVSDLPSEIKPDKRSQHAGGWGGLEKDFRYYRLWYADAPWRNWALCYCVHLNRKRDDETEGWPAEIRFQYRMTGNYADLGTRLSELQFPKSKEITTGGFGGISVFHESNDLNGSFADTLAKSLGQLIKEVTPVVNQFEDDRNQEDAP